MTTFQILYRNPNLGNRKLPIVVGKISSLPTWPKFTESKEEFLDMDSFSQMTVRTKLRETHCKFLKDPEGFLEQVTTCSTRIFVTTSAWFVIIVFCVIFI
jgi:hypothetical protein